MTSNTAGIDVSPPSPSRLMPAPDERGAAYHQRWQTEAGNDQLITRHTGPDGCRVHKEFTNFATKLNIPDLEIIPVSALNGDNMEVPPRRQHIASRHRGCRDRWPWVERDRAGAADGAAALRTLLEEPHHGFVRADRRDHWRVRRCGHDQRRFVVSSRRDRPHAAATPQ